MSTPVTPQEFGEAAALNPLQPIDPYIKRLLLAAAEQGEAHDRMMTKTAERLSHYEAIIDTLTAERDEARTALAQSVEQIRVLQK